MFQNHCLFFSNCFSQKNLKCIVIPIVCDKDALLRNLIVKFDKKLGVFQKPEKLVMSMDKERRKQRSLTTIEYRYQIDFGILFFSVYCISR